MLAIEVEYLLGRAVATETTRRDRAEWPPHPTRLFSALVDALRDVRNVSDEEYVRCESALRWLETLPPPRIAASIDEDVSFRTPVKFWVPINDETAERVRAAPLVEQRKRQERFFPAAVPADSVVVFVWPSAEPTNEHADALDRLAERVPYLGHSSSLVRVARRRLPANPNLAPDEDNTSSEGVRLRVPGPGRLDRLNAVHALRTADTLVQPPRGREATYQRILRPRPRTGPFGAARVIAIEGAPLGLEQTAIFVRRYRAAVLSFLGDDAPSVLTGHSVRGEPADCPHVAYAPLANVGHAHADGTIKGLAVVLPRGLDADHLLRLEHAMGRLRGLQLGAGRSVVVRPLGTGDSRRSLDFRRYTRTQHAWASVTPVALSLHPKPNKGVTEEVALRRDIAQLGLPDPLEVHLQDVSFIRGAPRARDVSRGEVSALRGRVLRHVHVRFAEAVAGPLLVGAGRFMGFGLLAPVEDA